MAEAESDHPLPAAQVDGSRVLNIGSGNAPIPGALNVDVSPSCHPDLVHDLRQFPWPFGDDEFSEVWCFDVIEHLPDTIATMEEIHRVATPGAIVHFTTPHFSCVNAFTDPTHCHQFAYRTFDYFTGDGVHDFYTTSRYAYLQRQLIFLPTRKNALVRRLANRWPRFYEDHLCWILPAWFISIDLVVLKE